MRRAGGKGVLRTPIRCVPLDRNAKVRVMMLARALMRRTEAGRAYGAVTAKALAVLQALLFGFHNAARSRRHQPHRDLHTLFSRTSEVGFDMPSIERWRAGYKRFPHRLDRRGTLCATPLCQPRSLPDYFFCGDEEGCITPSIILDICACIFCMSCIIM
jgi:hypothetical protein